MGRSCPSILLNFPGQAPEGLKLWSLWGFSPVCGAFMGAFGMCMGRGIGIWDATGSNGMCPLPHAHRTCAMYFMYDLL